VGPVYLGFDVLERQAGPSSCSVTIWFEVSDLPVAFDRCVAAGARVRYPPSRKPWGGYLASLYDPDGNIFGLSERAPASEGADDSGVK
jgi:predicted enzyme related to lactoylglutathione lyase